MPSPPVPPPPPPPDHPRSTFDQVVVASGHMTDRADRPTPRFPTGDEAAVTAQARRVLRQWQVGPGTLIVTGGARGADIIAAEQGLDLGAEVWLLLAHSEDEFVAESVLGGDEGWEERFWELRRRCPTWVQHEVLGPIPPEAVGDEDVFERNNEWCLRVAKAQAPAGRRRALVVWDGAEGDGRGGAADLAQRARMAGAEVEVIRPPASAGDGGDTGTAASKGHTT